MVFLKQGAIAIIEVFFSFAALLSCNGLGMGLDTSKGKGVVGVQIVMRSSPFAHFGSGGSANDGMKATVMLSVATRNQKGI